ncbi:MAG: ribonuclease D [Gammaproteobacteria bacterium]|nr:ribonuclease D [Gammaproteobacteria bacterium]
MPYRGGAVLTEEVTGEDASATTALIDNDDRLAACVAALGTVVGVDTEFIRVRTFFPIPALYQLAGVGGVALVDAQADADFDALRTMLVDQERTKIVHACSEDLEVIEHHLGVRPRNLVDTQLAHAFLGEDFSASYAKLVKHYLGLDLDKHETRSDWLQRPLSPKQLAYAREDAAYLLPIWQRQRGALVEKGRLDWFREDMARIIDQEPDTPDTWYRTLKGARRLKGRELAVLKSLVRWRENEVRRRNMPRAHLVRDEHLIAMARHTVLETADVGRLLSRRATRRYAKTIVDTHRRGREDPNPVPPLPTALKRRDGETINELRDVARREAARLGFAPELLARRRELEADYRHYREHGSLPPRYDGWRGDVLGAAFREILAAA